MTTHAITVDTMYGIPAVALHTSIFDRVVTSTARVQGLAHAPEVFVPQPVMGKSAEELRAYIEGKDPITGKPVMQEVIEGLTRGIAAEATVADRSTPRLVAPDTEDNLHKLFLENHWTDKLPIVLPTEERVAAMLAGTSHKPDKVVGNIANDGQSRAVGNHGREGRRQRRDGRCEARISPGDPGARGQQPVGALIDIEFRLINGHRQRTYPHARSA